MEPINWRRVIPGGLLCGLVINAFEVVLNGVVLQKDWAAAMHDLGRSEQFGPGQVAAFLVWGFLLGLVAIWFYAVVRDHYGAGPRTAVLAGLAVWLPGYLLASTPSLIMYLFPPRLVLIGLAVGLVEVVAGTLAGAWLYRTGTPPGSSAAAARL